MKRLHTILLKTIIISILIVVCSQTLRAQGRPGRPDDRMKNQDVLYLTPEQEKEVMGYLRENYQDRMDEVMGLKTNHRLMYMRKMTQAYREMRFMKDLKDQDEERYKRVADEKKLEKQVRMLVEDYWQTGDVMKKDELRKAIWKLLSKIFDYRQMNRQEEIQKLENKLKELKDVNEQRLANKDEIVETKLNDMLGGKPEMEW
jgi:hypothetical protein